jgi:hypothetical protein
MPENNPFSRNGIEALEAPAVVGGIAGEER